MSARSQLNSVALIGLLSVLACCKADSSNVRSDSLAEYRNNSTTQGLYEIREAARDFLRKENAKQKHEFSTLDPDIRIWVPRCAVPLTARWARETIYEELPGVDVICKKSVDKKYNQSWDVFVPLTSPQIAEEARRAREALQRKQAPAKKRY